MDSKTFAETHRLLNRKCNDVLLDRAEAYASEDRLENFKQIAILTGLPRRRSVWCCKVNTS